MIVADNNFDQVAQFLADKRAAAASPAAAEPAPNKVEPEAAVEEEEVAAPVEEEGGDEEAEAAPSLELSDDDVVEVMVDGELKTVALRDLKGAYSGEGAIQKRLQDATENRKQAVATAAKIVTDGEASRQAFMQVIQKLDGVLHTPTAAPPSQELRTKNPAAYLDQQDRYNREVAALAESRNALAQAFQDHGKAINAARDLAKQNELQLLNDNFMPIRNEATRAKAAQDILDSIAHYGFTEADMEQVIDHRLYIMAHDAAQYQKLLKKGKASIGDVKAEIAAKPRTIRTVASRQATSQAAAKQVAAVQAKAKATGKVEDVMAYLAAKRKT